MTDKILTVSLLKEVLAKLEAEGYGDNRIVVPKWSEGGSIAFATYALTNGDETIIRDQ